MERVITYSTESPTKARLLESVRKWVTLWNANRSQYLATKETIRLRAPRTNSSPWLATKPINKMTTLTRSQTSLSMISRLGPYTGTCIWAKISSMMLSAVRSRRRAWDLRIILWARAKGARVFRSSGVT